MDSNNDNDRVIGMKSILDLLIVLVLATAGFVSFGSTPVGKDIILSETNKSETLSSNKPQNIKILSPKANDQVEGKIVVSGLSNIFKNEIRVRVRDGVTNKILFEEGTVVNAPGVIEFGPWTKEIDFSKYIEGRRYFIEAFQYSSTNAETDKVSLPVIYWRKNI